MSPSRNLFYPWKTEPLYHYGPINLKGSSTAECNILFNFYRGHKAKRFACWMCTTLSSLNPCSGGQSGVEKQRLNCLFLLTPGCMSEWALGQQKENPHNNISKGQFSLESTFFCAFSRVPKLSSFDSSFIWKGCKTHWNPKYYFLRSHCAKPHGTTVRSAFSKGSTSTYSAGNTHGTFPAPSSATKGPLGFWIIRINEEFNYNGIKYRKDSDSKLNVSRTS